jgi:hypothetical protein
VRRSIGDGRFTRQRTNASRTALASIPSTRRSPPVLDAVLVRADEGLVPAEHAVSLALPCCDDLADAAGQWSYEEGCVSPQWLDL